MSDTGKFERAYFILVKPTPDNRPPKTIDFGARNSFGGGKIKEIAFQFNPKELSFSKTANWTAPKGAKNTKNGLAPEFSGAGPRSTKIDLLIDDPDRAKGVQADVEALFDALQPLDETMPAGMKTSPPWIIFGWGKTIHMVAIAKQVTATYTVFKQDGTPVRAACSVQLESLPVEPKRQNPTSGGLGTQRTSTVVAGDTLQSIATQEFGSPRRWRELADVNAIDDPMRLRTGTVLFVPTDEG